MKKPTNKQNYSASKLKTFLLVSRQIILVSFLYQHALHFHVYVNRLLKAFQNTKTKATSKIHSKFPFIVSTYLSTVKKAARLAVKVASMSTTKSQ